MEKVDTIVFDKTGDADGREPKVAAYAMPKFRLAASVERASEHPLAAAIADSARQQNLPLSAVSALRRDRQRRDGDR